MSDRLRDKIAMVVGAGQIPGQTIGVNMKSVFAMCKPKTERHVHVTP